MRARIDMATVRRGKTKRTALKGRQRQSADRALRTITLVVPAADHSVTDDSSEDRLIWNISAISTYSMKIAEYLGQRIGISGPQWMILAAIEERSVERGLSVKAVAAELHVDASFVSAQSKMLESRDFVRRTHPSEDRRITLLCLTEKANDRLKRLLPTRQRISECVRADLDQAAYLSLSVMVSGLRERMRREMMLIAAEARD